MHFHQKILNYLLEYRKKHNPNFNFLVRQRASINDKDFPGGKFAHGLVFQGTNKYCFVALSDKSGGANATKSVGIVITPTKSNGFSAKLEIVFPGETDSQLISFYNNLATKFNGINWDAKKERAWLHIGEFPEKDPSILYNWLDINFPIIRETALQTGIKNLIPNDERFRSLQEKLEIKLQEVKENETVFASINSGYKSIREQFSDWLKGNESSNKINSYLRAIDILIELLDKDLYLIHDKKQLQLLYEDLIKEQKNTNSKYYYPSAPSYGNNGFYSASIKALLDFLKEKNRIKIFTDFKTYLQQYNFTSGTINAYVGSVENKVPIEWKRIYNEEFSMFKYSLEDLEKLKKITRRTYQGDFKGKHNFSEFLTFLISNFKQNSSMKNNEKILPANQILYGPPGTGKTFYLKNELFDKYTSKETSISQEQHFENVVSNCSWWQVIAIALLELGNSKVSNIFNHKWVQKKANLSSSKTIRPTLWGQLQSHTINECKYVNVSSRQQPLIFNKTENSYWEILEDEVKELAPELYELKNSVDNFDPNPDKIIKHYDFVTFHQSFAYEDFIEGIKPVLPENEEQSADLGYTIEDGVFKTLCNRAKNDPDNRYAIFIDEINRGNVSAIFGELITLIEIDKRKGAKNEISIKLPYSKKEFSVPSNIDIYGTMNTADRSVEALDTALRRRFEFKEMMPDYTVIENEKVSAIQLSEVLKTINNRIELLIDRDHTIGHSYFVGVHTPEKLAHAFNNKIVPLLQEYFYGDYGKIGLVLGKGFVKREKNKELKFSSFKYEGKNDFITPTFILKPIDANNIIEAVNLLLETKEG